MPLALAAAPPGGGGGAALELGGGDGGARVFVALVLVWSAAAAAQAPALAARAQQLAPAGREASAIALPRAVGDGVSIVAPIALGAVADAAPAAGAEFAVAGACALLGAAGLALTDGGPRDAKGE